MQVALVGYGKMGRAIDTLVDQSENKIISRIWPSAPEPQQRSISEESLQGAKMAIEFTRPEAALHNIERLAPLGCSIVVGTTGWEEHLPRVEEIVRETQVGLLYASNFSLGMHIFRRLVLQASQMMGEIEGAEFALTERHHRAKLDCPSGSAKTIKEEIEPFLLHNLDITSVRIGREPGQHTLVVDLPYETITLQHAVRSRETFVQGAWQAAHWLQGKKGMFTISDMLQSI